MIKNQDKFLYCFKQFSVNFIAHNKVFYGLKSDFNQEISFSYHTTKIFLIPGQYGYIYARNIHINRFELIYYIYNYPKRYMNFSQFCILFEYIKQVVKKQMVLI